MKQQLNSLCIALLLFYTPGAGAAESETQSFVAAHADFFRLYFAEPTEIKAGYWYHPEQEAKDAAGEYDLQMLRAELEMPAPLSRDFFMRFGGIYEQRWYDFSGRDYEAIFGSDETLYRIVFAPGAGVFLSDDFLVTGRGLLGYYSDIGGGVEDDDFQALGDAQAVYRLNPQAQILGGIAYARPYEDYTLLPIGGVRLLSESGTLHVSITFPLEARLGFRLTESMEVYGGAWASGDRFHVRSEGEEFDVSVRERRVGGGFSFWFGSHVNLILEAGAALAGEFEVEDLRPSRTPDQDLDPAPYLAGKVGVAL